MASKKTRVGAKAGVKKPSRKPAAKPTRKLAPKAGRKPVRKPAPKRKSEPLLPMNELLVAAKREPDVVELPSRSAVSIAGDGGPETSLFQRSIGALYGIAYTLKFARRKAGKDFKIGPLEGCWWAEGAPFGSQVVAAARETWRWRLRIAVPGDVTESEVAGVILAATRKKKGKLEGSADANRVGLERIPSARMGRILHLGPYSAEPASFERIRAALAAKGLRGGNAHLEVYLSNPMRTEPSKLKTVLLLELGG